MTFLNCSIRAIWVMLLLLTTFHTHHIGAKNKENEGDIVIIALSDSRLDPIVTEIYLETRRLAPDCNLQINYLLPTRGEPSEVWLDEMEDIVSSLSEMDSLRLLVIIGDDPWILFNEVENGRMTNAPILLCGINKQMVSCSTFLNLNSFTQDDLFPTDSIISRYSNLSILYEQIEVTIETNIDMMLAQNPKLEQILLISGWNYDGVYNNVVAQQFLERKYPSIDIRSIDGRFASSEYLNNQLDQLMPNRAILYISWNSYSKWSSKPMLEKDARYTEPLYKATREPLAWDRCIGGYFADHATLVNSSVHIIR
ncbi:MAG: hypothetical protein ACRC6R_07975 [Bacteroidales bacterium]